MSERIHETLLVSRNSHSSPHPAPMGLRRRGELRLLAPFRPPRPLDNLLRERRASINTTDDVRVHAGCLSGHYDWPMRPCEKLDTDRLDNALRHREIGLERVEDDAQRPTPVLPRSTPGQPPALPRLQPRPGRGPGTGHPGQPAAHAADGEDRGRDLNICRSPSTRPPAPRSSRPGAG